MGSGPGSEIDAIVSSGSKKVYVESKFTIQELEGRATVNQLTNAVGANGSVILNVARKPTAAEIAALKSALGDDVFSRVTIVSSQTELFEKVVAALK